MTLAAISWGDKAWEDAVVLHELLHNLRHKQKAPSAFAPTGTELYSSEEADAHALESSVLNESTKGAYHAALSKVFQKHYNRSLWKMLESSALDMGKEVDSLFSQARASEQKLRTSQYLWELTRMWYAKQGAPDADTKAYMEMTKR